MPEWDKKDFKKQLDLIEQSSELYDAFRITKIGKVVMIKHLPGIVDIVMFNNGIDVDKLDITNRALAEMTNMEKSRTRFKLEHAENISERRTLHIEKLEKRKVKQNPVTLTISEDLLIKAAINVPRIVSEMGTIDRVLQMRLALKKPSLVKYMKDPSDSVRMYCAKLSARGISLFKNPTHEEKIASLEATHGDSIYHMTNVNEVEMMVAIKHHQFAIERYKKPTEQMQQLHDMLWVL